MQVTETLNEGLKRSYAITLTAAELDEKVDAKLAEAQPEVQMKGFRKGKVPMALLKKQFGPQVLGEAMQEAIDGAMAKHFEDSGDRPAMQPNVEMTNQEWKAGDDVEVAMSYEKLPEIPEFDAGSVSLERLVVEPEESAVTEALDSLAASAQSFADREDGAPAEDGDQVVIDFAGTVDGEPFDGGSAEDYPLTLGSNSFIPGFEPQLVGVKPGESKDVSVTFPDDYGAEHLKGKDAVFACTIKAVKAPEAAEIDDELAKRFGADDVDALKEQIRSRLSQEYAQAARQVLKRKLLDHLDEAVQFELPPTLVDTEAKQIAQQLHSEDNPDDAGKDAGEIETTEEHTKLAERRVRLGLFLAELGQKANVEVTDGEMTQAMMNQARQYPGQERQFFEFAQKNPQMRQQIQAPIFEDKVVDYIFELANITDNTVTKDDLQKAIEALEADDE
ncbi:MAG: trigger factor [Pseudomonadota bacterium]